MKEKAKFDNYRNITTRPSSETSCIVKQSKKTVFLPQILGIFKIVPIFYCCSNYFFDKTFEKHFEKAILHLFFNVQWTFGEGPEFPSIK